MSIKQLPEVQQQKKHRFKSTLSGISGLMEILYFIGDTKNSCPSALVLPPVANNKQTGFNHPLVTRFSSIFRAWGMSVLCLNYRGMGASQGSMLNSHDMVEDASLTFDWLLQNNLQSRNFWIAGINESAWTAAQIAMRRPNITGFVCLSPALKSYDFSFISPLLYPGLFMYGENDPECKEKDMKALEKLTSKRAAGKNGSAQLMCHCSKGNDGSFNTMEERIEMIEVVHEFIRNTGMRDGAEGLMKYSGIDPVANDSALSVI